MSESLNNTYQKAGLPPGSLVHVGESPANDSRITLISYQQDGVTKKLVSSLDEILANQTENAITWVSVEGLNCTDLIGQIGKHFNIHGLVQEDILNTHQRPKFEEYENFLYMVIKGFSLEEKSFPIKYEQVSIILLENIVFTFKEKQDDMFAPLINRLEHSKGQLRSQSKDYLVYAFLDLIVDQYFQLQDLLDEKIDSVEEELLTSPTTQTLSDINKMKRELIYLRRSVSPLRELLLDIQRSESSLISKETKVYFRDVYDHVLRVMETVESGRDMVAGLVDMYMSSVSNSMNEIMKILTLFASIFIPLTFVAGIYGMNFEYMPELKWKYGYPVLIGIFILITVSLVIFFKRKKWL